MRSCCRGPGYDGSERRAQQLQEAGLEDAILALLVDSALDVRERAKTALHRLNGERYEVGGFRMGLERRAEESSREREMLYFNT